MENVTVPAWSEVEVLASTNSLCGSGTWLVEGLREGMAVAVAERIADSHIAAAVLGPVDNTVGGISARKREMLYNCVQSCDDLSEEECEELLTLLLMYEDVLADKDEELGRTAVVQHSHP